MKDNLFIISNSVGNEKLSIMREDKITLGKSHYSWKIIARHYQKALADLGYTTILCKRPEIYNTEIARKTLGISKNDIHISINPIEHSRSLHGIKNIYVCGWEFPQITNIQPRDNPLENFTRVLSKADAIWCWSNYTKENLEKYGITTALTLPPPVCTKESKTTDNALWQKDSLKLDSHRKTPPEQEPLFEFMERHKNKKKFLLIVNPFDKRKDLKKAIQCFIEALNQNPQICLIVKLIIDNKDTKLVNISEILANHYQLKDTCKNITFIGENLTGSELRTLMLSAHFYYSTSSAEGLNLPLIEAMEVGCVPITTTATAMKDYISKKNAIIVDHIHKQAGNGYHSLESALNTTHFPAIEKSVVHSLLKAATLTKDEYDTYSKNAIATVSELFNLDTFEKRIEASIRALK